MKLRNLLLASLALILWPSVLIGAIEANIYTSRIDQAADIVVFEKNGRFHMIHANGSKYTYFASGSYALSDTEIILIFTEIYGTIRPNKTYNVTKVDFIQHFKLVDGYIETIESGKKSFFKAGYKFKQEASSPEIDKTDQDFAVAYPKTN